MRRFDVLFDRAERNAIEHAAFETYGPLGFPEPPPDRPWLFTNFVQSMDGIASLRGMYGSGGHISQSEEDRWCMDLLRAHADALMVGFGTLADEKRYGRPGNRGPVFRIADASLRDLREKLGRGRERNIIVTGAASLDLTEYKVFDGDKVDAVLVTTKRGAARLRQRQPECTVPIIVGGEGETIDFECVLRILRSDYGVRWLLCEGGPTLNGSLSRADLVDERFVTVSPIEVGQQIPAEQEPTVAERANAPTTRPTTLATVGFTKDQALWWDWLSCRKVGDHQFSRYRRKRQ